MVRQHQWNRTELKRTWTYSENELIRSRLELGEHLQNLLAELETEYELRNTQSVLCDQYKE